jgi:type VI secretion system protein ImpK
MASRSCGWNYSLFTNDVKALTMKATELRNAPSRPRLTALLSPATRLIQSLYGANPPETKEALLDEIRSVTDSFRSSALSSGHTADMVEDVIYAVYAAVDEAVLTSTASFRDGWKARSLQLERFGDQLAGEHFFDRLRHIRERGASYTEVAEVYHLCLRLGFRGRYALDDDDRLQNLTATLGTDVDHVREAAGAMAPHTSQADRQRFGLRGLASAWIVGVVLCCGLFAAGSFLRSSTGKRGMGVAGRDTLVHVPAKVARLKITLP